MAGFIAEREVMHTLQNYIVHEMKQKEGISEQTAVEKELKMKRQSTQRMREQLKKQQEKILHLTKANIKHFNEEIQNLGATVADTIRSPKYRLSVREILKPSIKILSCSPTKITK